MSGSEGIIDLTNIVPADSAVIDIVHPATGKPTGWKVELAGPNHPKAIAASQEISRERLQREKAIELAQVNGRKWKGDDETLEARTRRNVEGIVKRIIGWLPNPVLKQVSEQPLAFSETAAIELLLRPDMGWVLGQIADYLTSESAFTGRSAQS